MLVTELGMVTEVREEQPLNAECAMLGTEGGMVKEFSESYGAMGCYTDQLRGAGNALRRNSLLCQLCEKRFGARLILASGEEEAARGAALFALLSTGELTDLDQARAIARVGDEDPTRNCSN